MILDNSEKNLLIQSITEIGKLKVIFYDILNLYSTKSYMTKENISIFNKIIKTNNNKEIIIETEPTMLLTKLELNLINLNNNLEEINSLNNTTHTDEINIKINTIQNKLIKNIIINFIDNFMKYMFSRNKNICFSDTKNNNINLLYMEGNFFLRLTEKRLLIRKYFTRLKIIINRKNKNNKEYVQITIIFHNLFLICIIFPLPLNKFFEKDIHKKFRVIVNNVYGPILTNMNDDDYNNYSDYKFYKKLTKIFNNKFKEILINEISKINGKISLYKAFIIFLDYVNDYNKIFKIKCQKCKNKIKYNSYENFFSLPCYKYLNLDKNYINKLIDNIENENFNNENNIFGFFHEECINHLE